MLYWEKERYATVKIIWQKKLTTGYYHGTWVIFYNANKCIEKQKSHRNCNLH